MLKLNPHYAELKDSYLFRRIAEKTRLWQEAHPGEKLLRMGIGDVSQPLCSAVIEALHAAVEDQASMERFHGYLPENGLPEFREAVAAHYGTRGVRIEAEEVFVSSGASDELGDILDLFAPESPALIMEPAYPAYVDATVIAGRRILRLPARREEDFAPLPPEGEAPGLIYLCSPNNPTGAVFSREKLRAWVDYASAAGAVILFDAAYEAFIEEPELPRSIFEIEGARRCAIEICSLSKTAGFTGTRLGYTVIPKELERGGSSLHAMWMRNRTTKTNGVSYLLQKAGIAVFSPEGQTQTKACIGIYKQNARTLMSALEGTGLWYCGGKNAPYLWVSCPEGVGSWAFFDRLLNDLHIVATPGEGFGESGEGYIRFSTFGNPGDTEEAAGRLAKYLG